MKFLFVVVTFYCFAFDFELLDVSFEYIELFGHRVYFEAELGCCLVHKVDSFIWQETVGDTPAREFYGSNDSLVFDTHLMVVFVTFFQSA